MGGVAPCNANYCVINYRSIGVEFNFTTIFNRHIDSIYIFVKSIKFSHNRDTFGGLKKRRKKKDRFVMIASVYIRFERFFLKAIHCTVGESRVEVDTRLNGRGETRF